MLYKITSTKEECYTQLESLVSDFKSQLSNFKKSSYKEAQLRNDFLNPLLKSFGWDVENEAQKNQFLRTVVQEETIEVEESDKLTKKNPDYTLRISGNRKLFVEAKKASINIEDSKTASFQTRRYGWSANLNISVLTNFEHIIIYDCRFKPDVSDEAHVSRYKSFHFESFLENFDELYKYLSFESIQQGVLEEDFPIETKDRCTFDDYFLEQIENWRKKLANNVVKNNSDIGQDDINFLIQRLINRIIFLRICEDREIEKFETLKSISSYDELKTLFQTSDKKYNSGLFDFIEDNLALNIQLDDDILIEIFNELYYPISPYDFSVIDPTILSQIYEKYLGSKVELIENNTISIVSEPEVIASNGVVPTPNKIVKQIVEETLTPFFERIDYEKSKTLKVADICSGSGTFLISVFDFLLEKRTEFLLNEEVIDTDKLIPSGNNSWNLSLIEKQQILHENIFGVDINPYAVEVARFSLLLKLIENENASTINHYLDTYNEKILPNLQENIKSGNSLLDEKYFDFNKEALDEDELLFKIKPFDWKEEFPFLETSGGFDLIVGNPPYVRIQNFIKYSLEEIEYYRSSDSPYSVSKKDNFDKYYLFIERAIELLNNKGILGYIVPHKFFIVKGGLKLRKSITQKTSISKIIHFGVTQIFPNRSTYTAVIVLDKKELESFSVRRISNVNIENIFESTEELVYSNSDYSEYPWVFISPEAQTLFNRVKESGTELLSNIADIPVGLQTSADKIYIVNSTKETDTSIFFIQNDVEWEIEKNITLPCLYDVSISLFDSPKANSFIIFPYQVNNDTATVFSEAFMQANFPKCWKYLNHHKTALEKRSINGKEPVWYQYGRSQSLTKFHSASKIIFSVLSTGQSYAYDKENIQFTGGGNGPYYSILSTSEYSIFYILGLLSHPVIEAMVKSRASEFRGDYYSHGKQFLENLPIKTIDFANPDEKKTHNSIVKIVKNLIKTKNSSKATYEVSKKRVLDRKYNILYKDLIEIINTLYSIDSNDIETATNRLFITE